MKFLIVLCVLTASGLIASLPKIGISTLQDSLKASNDFNRIVNGQPARDNQIPHQCSVLSPVGGGFSVCGGSIISTGWVLTAAHCTVGYSQHNLRFGTVNLTSGGQVQTVFSAINHPDYNPYNYNFDISLIQIPSPLTLTPSIQTIRLPTVSQADSTFVDWQAIVSGWGSTGQNTGASQTLNWVHMRIIPNSQCADVFGGDVVVGHVVCGTGYTSDFQSHCGGDAGGPLTIVEGGTLTQIGIASFNAASGCHLGFPSGFIRTANFVNWISGHTNIAVRP